ncbi:MAG: PH domain-containing protein [Candidatus Hydrogenedentes bacterium]|jgi:putative membrane protein|nr:PH domain-containing protein [Candidatus Hydrogenedentota bacterium]
MTEETVIRKAEFNPDVCIYWLISGIVILTVIVVGIPFLIFWIPLGLLLTRRSLSHMECVLTNKALKVKKGMLVKIEKTIPLEKITDMGMAQGPIMRQFDLHTLTIETAGQSGQGALAALTGIVDAKEFREAVLNQRDAASVLPPSAAPEAAAQGILASSSLLAEIRDSLLRIEEEVGKLANSDSPPTGPDAP